MCTNDQEMCCFMTNDIKAGKMSVMKCEKCRDGYLIAKSAGNGYFLGCTNYKNDKTGCNNTIGTNEYLTLKNIEPDFVEPFVSAVSAMSVPEKGKQDKIVVPEKKTEEDSKEIQDKKQKTISEVREIKVVKENNSGELIYKGKDLMELARNTIKCLGHISENYYFGISILISVLRGGNRKQIAKHKLNEVQEYGLYADMSRDDMRAVVQWMISNHYMLKTKAKYPVLHPTYNGNHFDECITKKQFRDLKKYLEDPNREVFYEEDSED